MVSGVWFLFVHPVISDQRSAIFVECDCDGSA